MHWLRGVDKPIFAPRFQLLHKLQLILMTGREKKTSPCKQARLLTVDDIKKKGALLVLIDSRYCRLRDRRMRFAIRISVRARAVVSSPTSSLELPGHRDTVLSVHPTNL